MPYVKKWIKKICCSMINTKYITSQDMLKTLQCLKGKTESNFYQNFKFYYDEMICMRRNDTFPFKEDPFSRNAQSIAKNMHEVFLGTQFWQTKSEIKSMIIEYYKLYITFFKKKMKKWL